MHDNQNRNNFEKEETLLRKNGTFGSATNIKQNTTTTKPQNTTKQSHQKQRQTPRPRVRRACCACPGARGAERLAKEHCSLETAFPLAPQHRLGSSVTSITAVPWSPAREVINDF